MRYLLPMAFVLALPWGIAFADAPTADGNLYFYGVALNQNPVKGQDIDSFNWCVEELEKLFREQGAQFHRGLQVKLVRGKQATHAGVVDGLAWLRKNTAKNDLVVMYIGCHGSTDPNEGWGVATADGKMLWGHEIKAELGKLPCQVVIVVETCTSGGFAHPHKNDPPVPANVTALCACSGRQSTDNQLDMALAEGLCGRADFNHDGTVELDELIRYIPIRYKEWWPEPKTTDGSQVPVIVRSKTLGGSLKLTKSAANLVGVVFDGNWYSALEEKKNGDNYQVHFLGWANRPGPYFLTNSVPRESICLRSDGRPMLVEQSGRWYPARLLVAEGPNFKVHYIGRNEDEVVAPKRVFFPFAGDPDHPNYPSFSPGAPGTWARIGPAGAWKDTRAATVLNDRLYTTESNGCLYATDLSNGTWKQLGNPDFGNTAAMYAAGGGLLTIETDGSLFRVNPKDGSWAQAGPGGAWKQTQASAICNSKLFTVEPDGWLYATNPADGTWAQVGKPEFAKTVGMFAAGESLYTIERDGSLFRVNPNDGSRGLVGKRGESKPPRIGVALHDRLYTIDTAGCLFETDLKDGKRKQLGKAEFGGTKGLVAAGNRLFTIEKDGSLYWISVK